MEIALITGCANGIGRALAEELHSRKRSDGTKAFKVYATHHRHEALREMEAQGLCTAYLDVTDEESIRAAVQHVLESEGRIDLLVSNAGVAVNGWLAEVPVEDVKRMFNVNVFGMMRVIQAVAPSMMDRRSGKIATLCSVNSYLTMAFGGPYAATKSAVAMMTEALRIEVEPFGVTVTSVVPGWVKTQILCSPLNVYERYEQPDGQYKNLMYRVRQFERYMSRQGSSTQKAAYDIAQGLSKPKPARYVYTGTWLFFTLFLGFLQMWLWPTLVARVVQNSCHLDQKEKLGRSSPSPAAKSKEIPLSLQKEE